VRIDIKVTVAQCFSLITRRRTYAQSAVGAGEVCSGGRMLMCIL